MNRAAALGAAMLALSACQQQAQQPAVSETSAAPETPAPSSSAAAIPTTAPTSTQAAALVPEAEKGEKGARNVLLEWAHALERGDYDAAFTQWGAEAEARSGMSRAQHAAWWHRFKTITVSAPGGDMDGAAGSSYYNAPTVVVGKQRDGHPYRLEGSVVLRRVNDVDGASADQLHWHIEKVDLKPVS